MTNLGKDYEIGQEVNLVLQQISDGAMLDQFRTGIIVGSPETENPYMKILNLWEVYVPALGYSFLIKELYFVQADTHHANLAGINPVRFDSSPQGQAATETFSKLIVEIDQSITVQQFSEMVDNMANSAHFQGSTAEHIEKTALICLWHNNIGVKDVVGDSSRFNRYPLRVLANGEVEVFNPLKNPNPPHRPFEERGFRNKDIFFTPETISAPPSTTFTKLKKTGLEEVLLTAKNDTSLFDDYLSLTLPDATIPPYQEDGTEHSDE